MEKRQVLSILVANRPGVLTRISGLFSRRSFNIDSLSVCATEDASYSRMTVTLHADDKAAKQIMAQLEKQVDVAKVASFESVKTVFRELLIAKIHVEPGQRSEIVDICTIFKAKTIDISADTMILELTGASDKVDAFIGLIGGYGLLEMARTGGAALQRGNLCIKDL